MKKEGDIRMDKRGQFFIMAAVILSVFLFSLAFTANSVIANAEDRGFNDYSEVIEREVDNILDYQVYSDVPFLELDAFIYMLEVDFKDRGEEGNFVFIYGNSTRMKVKNAGVSGIKVEGNTDIVLSGSGDSDESKIRIGGVGIDVTQNNINNTEALLENLVVGNDINIYFNEQVYNFPVSDVNQVIFIIQKDVKEETYVEVR